jgi:hypothetical protein
LKNPKKSKTKPTKFIKILIWKKSTKKIGFLGFLGILVFARLFYVNSLNDFLAKFLNLKKIKKQPLDYLNDVI